jgi:acyl-CoA reductase-like NAD-dependent aldehyde dehydrogenase
VSSALPVLRNFVGGAYADPDEGVTSPVVDPCTGRAYARAPVSSARDVDVAMTAARRGFEVWRDATPSDRQRALLRIADAVEAPFVSEMPHGGFGHSGNGKDLSIYGFEEYTRVKHVMSYLG